MGWTGELWGFVVEAYYENNAAVLLSSDEAHFHFSRAVNKQNFRYWAERNPRELQERPLHSLRVTVWCTVVDWCDRPVLF